MGMENCPCPLRRGAGAIVLSRAAVVGDWQPMVPPSRPVLPREPSSLPWPPHGLGTVAVSPVVTGHVKIQFTRTRESSGLYTVTSILFANVTREDRHSLYHCTVHYWLRGQRRAISSQRVNVTVFCESGPGGRGTAWCRVVGLCTDPSCPSFPQTLRSTWICTSCRPQHW